MRELKTILEGILDKDLEQSMDVPDSISKLIAQLRRLKFERTYNRTGLMLYEARPKDPRKMFDSLWNVLQKERAYEVKDFEDGTIIALIDTPDEEQHMMICSLRQQEVIFVALRPDDDPELPPCIGAEIQSGLRSKYALDYIKQSRQKRLYKFPDLSYDLIKSSII